MELQIHIFLDLDTLHDWVVSFTLWLQYPRVKAKTPAIFYVTRNALFIMFLYILTYSEHQFWLLHPVTIHRNTSCTINNPSVILELKFQHCPKWSCFRLRVALASLTPVRCPQAGAYKDPNVRTVHGGEVDRRRYKYIAFCLRSASVFRGVGRVAWSLIFLLLLLLLLLLSS